LRLRIHYANQKKRGHSGIAINTYCFCSEDVLPQSKLPFAAFSLSLATGIATGVNIPFASLGVLTLGAVVAAIVAAQIPARRASRLDVLKAISL
jgi:ABC-type lipoprotein release transport system permease subunit